MSSSEVCHICSGSRDGSLAGYLSYSQSGTFLIIISVSPGHDLGHCSEVCSWKIPSAIISTSLDRKPSDHCPRIPSPLSASCVFSSPLPAPPPSNTSVFFYSSLFPIFFSFCSTRLLADPAFHTSKLPQDQRSWPQSHFATPSTSFFHKETTAYNQQGVNDPRHSKLATLQRNTQEITDPKCPVLSRT